MCECCDFRADSAKCRFCCDWLRVRTSNQTPGQVFVNSHIRIGIFFFFFWKLHCNMKGWSQWEKRDIFVFVNTKMWSTTPLLFLQQRIKHLWSPRKTWGGRRLQTSSSLTTETRALLICDPITGFRCAFQPSWSGQTLSDRGFVHRRRGRANPYVQTAALSPLGTHLTWKWIPQYVLENAAPTGT